MQWKTWHKGIYTIRKFYAILHDQANNSANTQSRYNVATSWRCSDVLTTFLWRCVFAGLKPIVLKPILTLHPWRPIQVLLWTVQIQMRRLLTHQDQHCFQSRYWFVTETPICNNGCVQSQRRKSPFQTCKSERIKTSSSFFFPAIFI